MDLRFPTSLLFLFLLNSASKPASSELVLEQGYSVETVLNGYKLQNQLQPFSILPRTRDLVLLDYSSNAFYTISLPISQESKIEPLSGKGVAGCSDGDLKEAIFNHPRSFAVDLKGNVYVAERSNHTIRKITSSGVTTIAGGLSGGKTGHKDGPAQNALFSNDYDLVFIPSICALLISDRANKMVRQINLKPEDCITKSHHELGVTPVSLIAVLCLIIGLIGGFVARPFLKSHEVSRNHYFNTTWRRCQIKVVGQILILFSGIKSAVVSSEPFKLLGRLAQLSFSQVLLMVRVQKIEMQCSKNRQISLLDWDVVNSRNILKPKTCILDPSKDLITFDEGLEGRVNQTTLEQETETCGVSTGPRARIDDMIDANISDFDGKAKQDRGLLDGSVALVKRKPTVDKI